MSKRNTEAEQTAAAEELGIQDAQTLGLPADFNEVEDTPIISWEKVQGQMIRGDVVRIRPAGLGKVLDLDDGAGVVTYGCPRILERKLEDLVGRTVAIICTGKNVETANGVAWGFRVFAQAKVAEGAQAF